MNEYYTYAYLRKDKTPYYIGKGKGRRAFMLHARIPRPPKERILILKKNLTEEQAFKHEIYMIAVLGRKDLGTGILRNLTDGGEGGSGWKPTEEQKQKSIRARTGRKATPAHCRAISEGNKGKIMSEESKAKMKLAQQHRHRTTVVSEETRRKRSETMKGRPHSPEHRRKLAEANRALARRERLEKEG